MNDYQKTKDRLSGLPKTWLVTGASGFIGSNLVEALLRLGQKVVGLDNFSTSSRRNLAEVKSLVGPAAWANFTMVEGDIRHFETCQRAAQGVDCVLHQAALGSVPRSLANPVATNENNVTGFVNVLWAAKESGVKRFVFASSSSVYGDNQVWPTKETDLGKCLSPYAVSKRTNELYAEVFGKCYPINFVGLRYFNVFGARQDPDGPYAAVIPQWVVKLVRQDSVYINGDGETSRDFCYIANVVQANILAATTENPEGLNQFYNVACGERTTLNQLLDGIRQRLLPHYPHLRDFKPTYREFRAGDVRHSQADIGQARKNLGYSPTHLVEQGLDEALAWYRADLARPVGTTVVA